MTEAYRPDLKDTITIPKTEILTISIMKDKTEPVPWDMERLNEIKAKVNDAKNALNVIEKQRFNLFMAKYDMFMGLKHQIAEAHHLNGKHLTNAWVKMWELLGVYGKPFLQENKGDIVSFHVAEMPGSMILSANHYFAQNGRKLDFYMSSLVDSTQHGIFGDNYGLFRAYPNRVISKGETRYGDMSERAEVEKHIKLAHEKKPSFFTSDLGNTDSDDPGRQEEICLWGHFGAAVAALGCLSRGPSLMILKMYTLNTSLNASLVLYLARYFEEFAICKPASSRPANSEIYFVGFGYHGIAAAELERLLVKLEKKDLSPLTGQGVAYQDLVDHIDDLSEHQISHLRFIADHYKDDLNILDKQLAPYRLEVKKYFSQFVIKPIKPEQFLL